MGIQLRRGFVAFSLMIVLALSCIAPGFAKPKNFIQRHPTMTAMAAGIGTTAYLKHRAEWKREHGEHLNFAERHPYMSGMGVAIVTHHMIKKSTN